MEKLSRNEKLWGLEEFLWYFARTNLLWAFGSTRDAARRMGSELLGICPLPSSSTLFPGFVHNRIQTRDICLTHSSCAANVFQLSF